ncbi:hypothetical protein BDFB_006398 [Asbolus verrucosus]|uniref:Uncharacterized protein n=1 Tax=Asbolus verrucosus TaxID=1661398 RepID=A0A482WBZ7_ASBVE|nr:hypothetical protein BDFB_006398 [Asbolus verrucosus]
MSVRVRSSLTNKRLRSGKSRAAPGTDHPVGGRTAEAIIQSCRALPERHKIVTVINLNKVNGKNTFFMCISTENMTYLRFQKFCLLWNHSRNKSERRTLNVPPFSLLHWGVRYGQWSAFGESIRRWHVTTRVENNGMILSETQD